MANIVLPSVDFNTFGNNVNVLTENGGAIYRTKSGDIIKQTLGNLSTANEDNISNLKFLAEQNGELKRISYTGDIGGGSAFNVTFSGTMESAPSFYFNEWVEVTSSLTVSHSYNDIINEMSAKQTIPNIFVVFVDQSQSLVLQLSIDLLGEQGILSSCTLNPFQNEFTIQYILWYTPANEIYLLAVPINDPGNLEFYIDYENNITCNYSYTDLSYGMAMNMPPHSAKCYYGNEFAGMMYFAGMNGESFVFSSFPTTIGFSDTTDIIQSFIAIVNSDNTVTALTPLSTLNEGRDVLWYNSNNDSVGEIYIPNIDTSQYGAFIFGGIWTYLNEEGDWSFLPDVTITTNGFSENNTPRYYLAGPCPDIVGAYLFRQVVFGSNFLSLSNGKIGLSSGEVYDDGGVMIPTVIMGIKSPS